MASMTPCRHT